MLAIRAVDSCIRPIANNRIFGNLNWETSINVTKNNNEAFSTEAIPKLRNKFFLSCTKVLMIIINRPLESQINGISIAKYIVAEPNMVLLKKLAIAGKKIEGSNLACLKFSAI